MSTKKPQETPSHVRREIVIAPPGCGKTEKLTRRLVDAIESDPPKSVLCITFTENAANEMKERIQKKRSMGEMTSKSQHICTLHSFCYKRLEKEAKNSGCRLRVIDDGYLRGFSASSGLDAFNESLDYEGKAAPEIRIEQVVRAASRIRQGKEVHFESWRNDEWQDKFKGFVDEYIKFKEALNRDDDKTRYVDFNDILLEADSKIRNGDWKERFDVVLVDEVQDLSEFQLDIIEHLVAENGSICFFGDPEQAIYSFMGANVKRLHALWLSCDEKNRHFFRVNHRSQPHILHIINKYAHNRIRVDKMWPGFNIKWEQKPSKKMERMPEPEYGGLKLIHNKDLDEDMAVYHAVSLKQEVWRIGKIIDTFDPEETNAILALHNHKVEEIVSLLKKKKKYIILGATEHEHTYLPRFMRAYISVCRNPASDESWIGMLAFLRKENWGKAAFEVLPLLKKHGLTPLDVFDGRKQKQVGAPLENKDLQVIVKELQRFGTLYLDCKRRLERLDGCSKENLDNQLCNWIAYCHKHLVDNGHLASYQINQWDTLLRRIKKELKYAPLRGNGDGLSDRLDRVDRLLSHIQAKDLLSGYKSRRQVSVMTVHKAKGLGFDNVFMCSSNQTWDYSNNAELDRVFFVGITRAQKRLVISYSDPAPTEEDLALGYKPKSRLKDMSFIQEPKKEADGEDAI